MPDKDNPQTVLGVQEDEWAASHDKSVVEYPATRFIVFQDGSLLRIAFGQYGYPEDPAGNLSVPRYNAAISMAPALAIQLRDVLMRYLPRDPGNGLQRA